METFFILLFRPADQFIINSFAQIKGKVLIQQMLTDADPIRRISVSYSQPAILPACIILFYFYRFIRLFIIDSSRFEATLFMYVSFDHKASSQCTPDAF